MKSAKSMFLDEYFTSDDYRLNYRSYKELGLICELCRELVFFKQGIKRVSHFSHFKDTGKNCDWKIKSLSNAQDSYSCNRKQSLPDFQIKFKEIIEGAIINYQKPKISSFQLLDQISKGEILVAEYNVNINAWVRWINKKKNRESLKNLAVAKFKNFVLANYKNNKSLSNLNRKIFLNILDYLCVPASKNILTNIVYYVFFLLKEKVDITFEEVRSKIMELMSCVDWIKEYKKSKESLTDFEIAITKFIRFYEFTNESIWKYKILNFANNLGEIGVKLDNEHERIKKEGAAKPGLNFSKYFGLYGLMSSESSVEINFDYRLCNCKIDKKGVVIYSPIKGEFPKNLNICWQNEGSEQHLIFKHNSVIVATFILLNNGSIQWKPLSEFDKLFTRIAISFKNFYCVEIVSTSLKHFFLEWLTSIEFAEYLSLYCRKIVYRPALVKLLLLFLAYAPELTNKFTETALLEIDMQVSLDEVAKTYKNLISSLVGDTHRMKRIYEIGEISPL